MRLVGSPGGTASFPGLRLESGPTTRGSIASGPGSTCRLACDCVDRVTQLQMYERILLALDARGLAVSAVPAVAELAGTGRSEVLVLHLQSIEPQTRTKEQADQLVEQTVAQLRGRGVAARAELRTISSGRVADALVDGARQFGADLIALGSHGRSELGGLLLGSVGQEVAARTPAAVMLVHDGAGRPSRRWPDRIRMILLAVDRSTRAEAAIRTTMKLCDQHRASVSVLYVEPVFEAPTSAQHYVRGVVDRLLGASIDARAEGFGSVGSVPIQIADAAERTDADLIVIGSRRRGELAALVLGSVARELVRLTTRPVLLAETTEARVDGESSSPPQ